MTILLDTNADSALLRGHDEVADRVRRAERVLFSTVVAGELLLGFRLGTRLKKNMAELDAFLENLHVSLVPVTLTTADRFARIAAALRTKGKPIPTNDIWIAAHAKEAGGEVLSFDAHFGAIDGLAWVALPSA